MRTWAERKVLFNRLKRLERRRGTKRFQPILSRWYAWADRQTWR